MACLVTGVAGFIGSRITEKLLLRGEKVIGIDCFTDYYPRWMKARNLARFLDAKGFEFIEGDLVEMDLLSLLEGVDVCYHLAAQAGVRKSWGREFAVYTRNNVLATQKLLEAAASSRLKRMVFASSSSVYGDAPLPFREEMPCLPVSPYGLTKLACEHLVRLYHSNFGVPAVSLRYFTVYGPGQRPDMAFHRFILAMYRGATIQLFGDGTQTRDFTYVDDTVEATLRAGEPERKVNGRIINISSGSALSVIGIIGMLKHLTGREPTIERAAVQRGDARHTAADTTLAREHLGYSSAWNIEEGLKTEIEWIRDLYSLEG